MELTLCPVTQKFHIWIVTLEETYVHTTSCLFIYCFLFYWGRALFCSQKSNFVCSMWWLTLQTYLESLGRQPLACLWAIVWITVLETGSLTLSVSRLILVIFPEALWSVAMVVKSYLALSPFSDQVCAISSSLFLFYENNFFFSQNIIYFCLSLLPVPPSLPSHQALSPFLLSLENGLLRVDNRV